METTHGGILSGLSIEKAVEAGDIVIDPWNPTKLKKDDRINPASYDLTLGEEVAVYSDVVCEFGINKNNDNTIDGRGLYTKINGHSMNAGDYEKALFNGFLDTKKFELDSASKNKIFKYKMDPNGFLLKPGIGYLMHTAERVKTDKYVPIVDGKSSIGRLFIAIHVTAGYGDPGYDGQYTLEVITTHPVVIYPGMNFCQMRFHTLVGEFDSYKKKGKYKGKLATGPVPSHSWKSFQK